MPSQINDFPKGHPARRAMAEVLWRSRRMSFENRLSYIWGAANAIGVYWWQTQGGPVARDKPRVANLPPHITGEIARWRIVRRNGALAAATFANKGEEMVGFRWADPNTHPAFVLWCWCEERGDLFAAELRRIERELSTEGQSQAEAVVAEQQSMTLG